MRKETSNQFTEGLISDLNPIITPNTVLTDNLNGTLITYNGNEYSLQNDRGNYELKDCRLPANYIPVGIKEYGDILYIVSYNPITEKVQIGSYPSPLMVSKPIGGEPFDATLKSIIKKGEQNYSEVMNTAEKGIIFDGKDYLMNPGDKYCLQTENESSKLFETCEYFILDEKSSTYNVTSDIKITKDKILDFKNVPWTIPGWLIAKMRLAEIGACTLNVREFYVQEGDDDKRTAYFKFNIKLNLNDPCLIKKDLLKDWCEQLDSTNPNIEHICFNFKIDTLKNEDWENLYSTTINICQKQAVWGEPPKIYPLEQGWVEWYEKNVILFKNIKGTIQGLNKDDVVKITVTPIFQDADYIINYDNLTQSLIFDLKTINDKNWNIGQSYYKFYVNNDKTKQVIYANIDGPLITDSPTELYYILKDINGNCIYETSNGRKKLDEFYIGENLFFLEFDDKFSIENIYTIEFHFINSSMSRLTKPRILITSKIFNDFITTKTIFDRDIEYNEWASKYFDLTNYHVDFDVNWDFGEPTLDIPEQIQPILGGEKYSMFLPSTSSFSNFNISASMEGTFTNNTEVREEPLEGQLWNELMETENEYVFEYTDEDDKEETKSVDDPITIKSWWDYNVTRDEAGFPFAKLKFLEPENFKIVIPGKTFDFGDHSDFYVEVYVTNTDQRWKYIISIVKDNMRVTIEETEFEEFPKANVIQKISIPNLFDNKLFKNYPCLRMKLINEHKDYDDILKWGSQLVDAGFTYDQKEKMRPFYQEKIQNTQHVTYWLLFKSGDNCVMIPFGDETSEEKFLKVFEDFYIVTDYEDFGMYDNIKIIADNTTIKNINNLKIKLKKKIKHELPEGLKKDLLYDKCISKIEYLDKEIETYDIDIDYQKLENCLQANHHNLQTAIVGRQNDYKEWEESVFSKEYSDRREFKGVYKKNVGDKDPLLKALTESQQKGDLNVESNEFSWVVAIVGGTLYKGFVSLKLYRAYQDKTFRLDETDWNKTNEP